jgi:hypothetical protein
LTKKRCEDLENEIHIFSNKLTDKELSVQQQVSSVLAKLKEKEDTLTDSQNEVKPSGYIKGGAEGLR